jgi:hypothetical protein
VANPAAPSGCQAAHLDSKQFRSPQTNSGLPQGPAHPPRWQAEPCGRPTARGRLLGVTGRAKVRHEAARIHHACRRRGRVAAPGERAADAEAMDHRILEPNDRLGLRTSGSPFSCSGCANSAGSMVGPSRSRFDGRRDAASAQPRSLPSSSSRKSMLLFPGEP